MRSVSVFLPGLFLLASALKPVDSHAGERWTQYTSFAAITRMADGGKDLWLGTAGGLIRQNKATGENTYYNQANASFTDSRIRAVDSDQAGRLWATTQGGMLAEFDGIRWSNLSFGSPLEGEVVVDIAWDFRGSLWVLAMDRDSRKPSIFRRQEGQWTRLYLDGADAMPQSSLGENYGHGYFYSYGIGSAYGISPSYLQTDGVGQAWVVTRAANRTKVYRISNSGRVDTADTPHHLSPRWLLVPRTGSPFWICGLHLAQRTETGWDTTAFPSGVLPQSTSHPRNIFAQTTDDGYFLSLNRLVKYREGGWENISVPGDTLGRNSLLLESVAGNDCPQGNCVRTARGDRVGSLAGESWNFIRTAFSPIGNPTFEVIRPRGAGSPDILMAGYGTVRIFRPATSQATPVDLGSSWAPGQTVHSLGEDHRGTLWVRGSRSLVRAGADGTETFTPENSPLAGYSEYLPAAAFMAVDARGVVWAADSGKLISIPDGSGDVRTWKSHPLPAGPEWGDGITVTALAMNRDGSIWFSGRVQGPDLIARGMIGRYDGKTWRMFGASHHVWLDSLLVKDLRCDGNGQVWALFQAGLLQWDGTAWKEHARTRTSPIRNGVQAMTVDAEGRLWAATTPPEAALMMWTNRWETVDDSKARIATSTVRSMAFDASGRLWMATTGDGVMVLDPAGAMPTGIPSGRRFAPSHPPSLYRQADGGWRLFPGPLSGENRLAIRILTLQGTEVPGTDDMLRPSPVGGWTWPGPARRLSAGKYLLSVQGRHGRKAVLPFLQGRP